MSKNDPAFPLANFEMRTDDESGKSYVCGVFTGGLTKREYFAAMAMQGYLAQGFSTKYTFKDLVRESVRAANELIAELERTA